MSFIYPNLLYGLLALSIPIIIHLFHFRKAKKIYFSSNHLLQHVKEAKRSKLKLKHWLILAARLLFITFLVLAFAQPFQPAKEDSLKGKDVILYLDNSLSMTNETAEGLSAFDQAINYVSSVLDLYPKGTSFKLITNNFVSSVLFSSKEEVSEVLKSVQVSGVSRSLDEVQSRINFDAKRTQNNRKDVYLISDFQKSTTPTTKQWAIDSAIQYYILPVAYKVRSNVYVDSVFLQNPFLIANEENSIEVILKNEGRSDVDDLILKLYINNAQVSNASVSIQAGGTQTASFELSSSLPQYSRCRISFEEFPVSFDNDFYFDLHAAEKVSVLEIRGTDYAENISKAFGNKNLFIFNSTEAANLDYNLIKKSNLVILNQIQDLEVSLTAVLSEYLNQGGDLFIVPPSGGKAESYRSVLPLQIQERAIGDKQNLAQLDINHPFFKNIFEGENKSFQMPKATKYWHYTGLKEPLIEYKNGESFFVRSQQGEGNVYALASPLTDKYTNFHKHALFIPVLYRMAALSKKYTEDLYYSISDPFVVLDVKESYADHIYKLRKDEQEVIPVQKIVQRGLFLEIPKDVLHPGFYDLSLQEELKGVLSFNYDKKESRLEQYTAGSLQESFAGITNIDVLQVDNVKAFNSEMKSRHYGVELWKYALALALFFLLTEVLLIRFL